MSRVCASSNFQSPLSHPESLPRVHRPQQTADRHGPSSWYLTCTCTAFHFCPPPNRSPSPRSVRSTGPPLISPTAFRHRCLGLCFSNRQIVWIWNESRPSTHRDQVALEGQKGCDRPNRLWHKTAFIPTHARHQLRDPTSSFSFPRVLLYALFADALCRKEYPPSCC